VGAGIRGDSGCGAWGADDGAVGLSHHDPAPWAPDFDGDGLTDLEEPLLGTDPADADSDDDGVPDGEDLGSGTAPGTEPSAPGTSEAPPVDAGQGTPRANLPPGGAEVGCGCHAPAGSPGAALLLAAVGLARSTRVGRPRGSARRHRP
jgi:hypothetical protein